MTLRGSFRASTSDSPAFPTGMDGSPPTDATRARSASTPSSMSTMRPASGSSTASRPATLQASRCSCRVRPARRKAMDGWSPSCTARARTAATSSCSTPWLSKPARSPWQSSRGASPSASTETGGLFRVRLRLDSAERNDLVVDVVANVGGAQPWNASAGAPEACDLFGAHPEVGVVVRNIAHPAQPDAGELADRGRRGDVQKRAVDAVHRLGHLFEHQHVTAEIGLHRRADQLAEHDQVVRSRLLVRT